MKRNRAVEKTIKLLRQQVKAAVRELNQQAARLLAKGAYAASERVVRSAQDMIAFGNQVDVLWKGWRGGKSATGDGATQAADRTPLWEFYPIVARSLVDLGGEAKVSDIVAKVGEVGADLFRSGDRALTSSGTPVWTRAVRRARNPMIKEGFLESIQGGRWRLTKLGRNLVKRTLESQAQIGPGREGR